VSQVVSGVCEYCGMPFVKAHRGKPYRFCSRACGVRGRSGPTQRNQVRMKCRKCGKKYEIKASHAGKSLYCSMRCLFASRDIGGIKNPNFKNSGLRVCEGCGCTYKTYDKARRFCSANCSHTESAGITVKNLRRGNDAELRCAETLDDHGFAVLRSARSRGPFDVFAIGQTGIYLIQVKRSGSAGRRFQRKTIRELTAITVPATAHKQIWCWVDQRGWFITDILSDGATYSRWSDGAFDYQEKTGCAGYPVSQPSLGLQVPLH
jgi:Holliday junction resolvase